RRGDEPRRGTTSARLRRRPAADSREHRVHRGVEAGGVVLLAEARRDGVTDDRGRHDVGDHRLEAVADLDPQLALLQNEGEDDAEEQPRTSLWAPSRRRAPPRRTAWAGNRASRPRDFPG